jgi:type II secretory pathway pseudopilin PulG
MAALLVALAVIAVLLTAAMPVWRTAAKREKEAELVWRAGQYVRAIALFRRKYANASPPNLDILLNERFLRKKYKDPITNDDFQLVYAADQMQRPGLPGQGGPVQEGQGAGARGGQGAGPPAGPPAGGSDSQSRFTAGARGGIIGVVSKSKETGLRLFNGRSKYNEWAFTPETVGLRMPGVGGNGPGGNAPGMNVPGGGAGTIGPGGRPVGGASRGQINLDRSRPQTSQPSGGQPRSFGLPQPQPPPR